MEQIADALARLRGRRIYIDANIFIYFFDRSPGYFDLVSQVLTACAAHQSFAVTGEAAVAEVMVGVYRQNSPVLTAKIKEFFARKDLLLVTLHDKDAFDLAAMLAAKERMKLIDALHLATAARSGCAALLTNDAGIKPIEGVEIVRLSDFAPVPGAA